MTTLLIKPNDIAELTGFSGNIDLDSIANIVNVIQRVNLKAILGADLLAKIIEDYENDDLTGDYKTIYDDYVVYMLAFYSCSLYLSINAVKVTNNGVYRSNAEGATLATKAEVDNLNQEYKGLGASIENAFNDFMKIISIPEWKGNNNFKENNFIPWH